ncbi:MAG: M48 family metallopeptidase [Methanobrevibacter sp.]|jgi:predicted metal-dependent hydrolase|nr:M48 family metallopeptidase [Candidatus Methanovirga basalitermitum]
MNKFKYKIIRSKRKTIAIHINKNGSLEVRSPFSVSDLEIEEFVNSKERWIKEHEDRILDDHQVRNDFRLNFGDTVKLMGKNVLIVPIKDKYAYFKDDKFYIYEKANSKQIMQITIEMYKKIAKPYIGSRISYFTQKTKIIPSNFRITSAKTRWGSCSGKNSLNFSWRLLMASDDVIDYVVVHELCHIKEHNHSKRFWREVENMFPDYREKETKLKELGKKLNKENWD